MPPVVARPRAALITAIVFAALLLGGALLGWALLAPDVRAAFTPIQVGTLVLFLLFMIGFLLAVGLSYVRADARGLRFRNGLRSHALAWSEIAAIRYLPGDPFAYAVLVPDHPSGRERYQLLGIQQTDGARALRLAAAVRAARPSGEAST